jgi:DNA-binding NarL/FixJ family response regulator
VTDFPAWVDEAAATEAGLTLSQLTALVGVADGLTNDSIGRRTHRSAETIRTHIRVMCARFGVDNRTSLVVAAYNARILLPRPAVERAA